MNNLILKCIDPIRNRLTINKLYYGYEDIYSGNYYYFISEDDSGKLTKPGGWIKSRFEVISNINCEIY